MGLFTGRARASSSFTLTSIQIDEKPKDNISVLSDLSNSLLLGSKSSYNNTSAIPFQLTHKKSPGAGKEQPKTDEQQPTEKKVSTYVGSIIDDKKTGFACLKLDEGEFRGFWKVGLKHGPGTEINIREGTTYIGDYVNGMKEGHGILNYSNGMQYSGGWLQDLRSGQGIMRYDSYAEYRGDWLEGKRSGWGVYVEGGRIRYEGEWKDHKRSGKGVQIYQDSSRYSGDWLNDLPNGKGTMVYPDKSVYTGSFKDGLRNGFGVYSKAGKDRKEDYYYAGNWKEGKPHGEGTMRQRGKEQVSGVWEEGLLL